MLAVSFLQENQYLQFMLLQILFEILFSTLLFSGKPKRRLAVVVGISAFFLSVVVVSVVRHASVN